MSYTDSEARYYIDRIINQSIENYKKENEELKKKIIELENQNKEIIKENDQLKNHYKYMPYGEGYYEALENFTNLSLH